MPGMLVIIPVVIVIPISLARFCHYATGAERDKSGQEGASNQALYVLHVISRCKKT